MKTTIVIIALLLGATTWNSLKAEPSDYRIFGQITTVENKTYKGYITWNENKRWWIDYFEATKKDNPYTSYFKDRNDVYFINNNNRSSKPPVHVFMCRFGNISKIRLIATNTIELQVKDGNFIELKKGRQRHRQYDSALRWNSDLSFQVGTNQRSGFFRPRFFFRRITGSTHNRNSTFYARHVQRNYQLFEKEYA